MSRRLSLSLAVVLIAGIAYADQGGPVRPVHPAGRAGRKTLRRPSSMPHPKLLAAGLYEHTTAVRFPSSPPLLIESNGRVALLLHQSAKVFLFPMTTTPLGLGPVGRQPDEPDPSDRESIERLAAPVRDGWVLAKESRSGPLGSISLWRAGFAGGVFQVGPHGDPKEPVPLHDKNGSTWPAGEHVGSAQLLFLAAGEKGSPLLLGFSPEQDKLRKDGPVLGLAFVGEDGHIVKGPLYLDYKTPLGFPIAATATPNGFLVAERTEVPTGNAYVRGDESIVLLHIAPDGTTRVTDTWVVPKAQAAFSAVRQLLWAREGTTFYLLYGGFERSYVAHVSPEGARRGDPFILTEGPGQSLTAACTLLAAALLRGSLRVMLDDPIRLIELDPARPAARRVLFSYGRGAAPWSAILTGDRAYVIWYYGDSPPPYLTVVSP